jgi:hypothetical protein
MQEASQAFGLRQALEVFEMSQHNETAQENCSGRGLLFV